MFRMYEVIFYGAFPPRIIFAKTRWEIWQKYPGIIDKIYRIVIT